MHYVTRESGIRRQEEEASQMCSAANQRKLEAFNFRGITESMQNSLPPGSP